MKKKYTVLFGATIATVGLFAVNPLTAQAHCDTTEGPVYDALQASLEEENFDYIAHWVSADDEAELKNIYDGTISIKNKTDDPEINDLAEYYLFENFVRIHRASEGAPYTGISAEPVQPGIIAADESITQESLEPLENGDFITVENREHIEEVFAELLETKDYDLTDTEAGRAYVENYVIFTHLFEEGHDEPSESHAGEQVAHTEESHVEAQDETTETQIEETGGNWFTRLFTK